MVTWDDNDASHNNVSYNQAMGRCLQRASNTVALHTESQVLV